MFVIMGIDSALIVLAINDFVYVERVFSPLFKQMKVIGEFWGNPMYYNDEQFIHLKINNEI